MVQGFGTVTKDAIIGSPSSLVIDAITEDQRNNGHFFVVSDREFKEIFRALKTQCITGKVFDTENGRGQITKVEEIIVNGEGLHGIHVEVQTEKEASIRTTKDLGIYYHVIDQALANLKGVSGPSPYSYKVAACNGI